MKSLTKVPEIQARRRAKGLLDQGHSVDEVAELLAIKPREIKGWIRKYEWASPTPAELSLPVADDDVSDEFHRLMSRDCIDTLHQIRRLPKTADIDDLLKLERIKELLSKRAERELDRNADKQTAAAKTVINIAALREFGTGGVR